MAGKLKLGAVGVGNIFRVAHIQALLDHPEIEVAAVCDINPERARKVAADYSVERCYTDYREMLKQEQLDIVDICTPNLLHSEIAIAAFEAGCHVFTEKPDAVSAAAAQAMAKAAEKSGKRLMAMRNNRFMASSQFLKKYIDAGHMGEIYTGRCGWLRRRGIPGQGGWFTTKELSGGGPLIDLGVHMLDLAIWLMGNPRPVAVSGAVYTKFADNQLSDSIDSAFGEKQEDGTFDVEDLATGFIRFDNGATLQIEFSWASNIAAEGKFVELRGTKAGSLLKNDDLQLFSEIEGQLTDISPKLTKQKLGIHAQHLNHFIDVIQGRAEPINTPAHGVDLLKILDAIYQSAKEGHEVTLQVD